MEGLHPDVAEVLLSEQDIRDIVTRMGAEITRDYEGRNPLIVAVLRGAVVFTADIMRAIKCDLGIDFMAVSSYGDGVKSSGVVRIVKDLDTKIEDRDVLIVEDILDSGLTLSYLMRNLAARKPRSLEVAAFLVKDISPRCSRCSGTRHRPCPRTRHRPSRWQRGAGSRLHHRARRGSRPRPCRCRSGAGRACTA